jgi:NADPH-dependent ferric siderophore reductase
VIGDGCTMAAMQQLPEERRPAGAYYTVRAWRPERGELDLWFVLHASEGAVSSWAAQAGAGDRLALWGPRLGYEPPPGTTSQLLLADETGLAAVAAILAEIDQATAVRVLAETVDADHAISFPERPNVEIDWLYRGDDEPGTGNRFLDAVEKLPLEPEGLYAFGGAESRQLTAIRSYLRRELGLDREQVHLTGYWRRSIET